MPVELDIVESVTALNTTVVEVILESASEPGPAGPGVAPGGTAGQVLTKDSGTDFDTSWQDATGGGAPDDATYLVTTANGSLSAEVVVGATPGGELGGTWASPTVDATHSGSSHAAVQAAAEATAAAALSTHESDTTGVHGIADTSALALTASHPTNATFNDHSARHENGGADEISIAGLDGTPTELTNHLNDTSDAHDASAISSADGGGFYTGTDVEAILQEIGPQLGAGGSGEALRKTITQTAHGFAVGDVLKLDGADTYALAQADSAANAEVAGIVVEVPGVNSFVLHVAGYLDELSGLAAETVYFLSPSSAGDLTATPPSAAGQVSKPLLVAAGTDSGWWFNWRGIVNGSMGGGGAALVWKPLTLLNGAANLGGGYGDPEYAIDTANELLWFRGAVNPGTDGQLAQVDSGDEPSVARIVIAFADGTAQNVEILASGIIDFFGNPTGTAFLDGMVVGL